MSALAFELPAGLEATEPPEERGLARDEVRLLVAERARGEIAHHVFRDLPIVLSAGDLLVVNVSATLPAAVEARRAAGSAARVHFATKAPGLGDAWRVVELRTADGAHPVRGYPGESVSLAGGARLLLIARYAAGQRLMLARLEADAESVEDYLARHGEPIRYGYVPRTWPLEAYQNVYATSPGSAEMPSAGRPFTAELLTRLLAHGVLIAPITLHTGVSSPESHEPPFPEYFEVPEVTATTIKAVRAAGGRVIAVGTTVVRALETAAQAEAGIGGSSGWTNLVIEPERRLRVVDGLVTGWHAPEASHLKLLGAVAGQPLLARAYESALERGYLWHEFGDSCLFLP